jgi:hypothetical protein
MVTVVVWAGFARVLLAVMVPWAGTEGAASPPLVRSCRGDNVGDVQESDVVESNVDVLFGFRRGLAGSSGELKPRLRW